MIKFTNTSKTFRRSYVLKDVTLEISKGDRVALVGSNGAGKTTLIRCLLGEYHCEGKVEINGLDPRDNRQEVLKHIGFVPQLPPPVRMPVLQLVNFAAAVSDSDPERMCSISRQLGFSVDEHRKQPFNRLSGGQKQKLLISIALGRDCDVLVMDEPAANLDPEARHLFFSLLEERRESTAMLISSHRLDEVAALVNRVVELDRGSVVLDDNVIDQVGMDSVLGCVITLSRVDEAFSKTIQSWGFEPSAGNSVWYGRVSGPDRLRFLGMLSRYAGLLAGIELSESSVGAARGVELAASGFGSPVEE